MAPVSDRAICGPCGSGDRCIQPWGMVDPNYRCNRCDKSLHQLCAAVDATKASEGQFDDPESIRICYNCLRPGESPNHFGVVSTDEPATKRARSAGGDESRVDEKTSLSISDLDNLQKAHESISDLLAQDKVVAPQSSKKTIWWRAFHTWNMEKFGDEVVQPLAYCNICGKSIKMSKVDRSPTPLKRHLQIHHKHLFSVMHEQKLKDGPVVGPPRSGSTSNSYHPKKGKKDVIRTQQLQSIVRWMVETDQPLSVVEEQSFRDMTSALVMNPRHSNVFDLEAVVEYMAYLVSQLHSKMKEKLADQSIAHVTEYWKSGKGAYHVDRAHWIDDSFKLQNVVLACDATNDKLWETVSVDHEKQVAVVVSNKTTNGYFGSDNTPIFQGLEHELQNIAKIALESMGTSFQEVLQKVGVLIEKVQSSSLAKEALVKAQADLSNFYSSDAPPVVLIIDSIKDAWWSTQEMIGRVLYLRKALEYLMLDTKLQEEIELLTRQEWELLEQVQQVWEPLNIAPQLLQKQKFVTISLVPIILQIIAEDLDSFQGQDGVDANIKECITKMAKAWEDRYGKHFPSKPFQGVPVTIWLAHVLDPRFKALDVFNSSSTDGKVVFKALLDKMVEVRLQEKSNTEEAAVEEKGDESPIKKPLTPSNTGFRAFASSRSSLSGNKRGLQRLSERFNASSKSKQSNDGDEDESGDRKIIKEECQLELEAYQSVKGMQMWIELEDGSKDFEDPLTWWQQHHEQFPTLWKMARTYLPIPATCARSEIAFDPEAHALIATRCRSQATSSKDVKMLKENATLINEEQEQKDELKEERDSVDAEAKQEQEQETESVEL